MKLIRLELQDYQGLRTYTLDAEGQNVSIHGTNGTGKTTIANSLTWLLFDKSYTGEKNYTPKTIGEDGQELHHLDHRAEATFQRDDGSQLTIAKVFREVWKKKRGSSTEEFSGHVTDAYIDGVPVSTSEYKRSMEAICPPDRAKILTDPRYFAKTLHWEERRAILLELCGDVTDAEVIGAAPDLADLWDYLRKPGTADQYYTVGEFGRIAASRKAELNRDLTILPARIDEVFKSIPDTADLPPEDTIEDTLRSLEQEKATLQAQTTAMTEDDHAQALHRQVAEIDLQITRGRVAYLQAIDLRHRTENEAIRELGKTLAGAEAAMIAAENRVRLLTDQIEDMRREREGLLRRHAEVKARVWTGSTICAACGQPLPEDRLQEARETFNQQRSRELGEINQAGQLCSKAAIEAKQQDLDAARADLEAAQAQRDQLTAELAEIRGAVTADPTFEETPEYAALNAQRAAVAAQLAQRGTAADELKAAQNARVGELAAKIREVQTAQLTYATARKRRERLAELAEQEKELAREYERFDRGVFLCEAFTREKVAMLDERINSRFTAVRFRLFRQQINGGLADCCDVLCPTTRGLTPYDSANNAAQIQAGAEIASALSRHWGITMPLIVDNAESIVGCIPTQAQVIRLVVDEQDERLRTVYEGTACGAA